MCAAPISAADGWIAVCPAARLNGRAMLCVSTGELSLLIIRDGEALHACERACPHEQADLARGHVEQGRLHCPRHLAWFDLASGAISPGWSSRALRRYAVKIADGMVWIDPRAASDFRSRS